MRVATQKDFIEKSKIIHGNKYDYSKSVYINTHKKIIIICPNHGVFKQAPNSHLAGKGCYKCGRILTTQEDFIKKANIKHSYQYDYSKTVYTKSNSNIIIICKKHGEFYQNSSRHLRGQKCFQCTKTLTQITTEKFIIKANKKHNNEYDYSKTIYNGCKEKIIIICKKHGKFILTADNHLSGRGCAKCSFKVPTTEEFINSANQLHNFKYNYSKFIYIKTQIKGIIICPIHGDFLQTPNSHLNGAGCKKCITENYANTQEKFIEKANIIHNNKYDYSVASYQGNRVKLVIICPLHGNFEQSPNTHLSGSGCSKCSKNNNLTTNEFIEKANCIYNYKYNYFKTVYVNCIKKIIITCKTHGDFKLSPEAHLKGHGCKKCSGAYSPTTEEFIEAVNKIHENKYNYSKFVYINCSTKGIIICPLHGEFSQTPSSHKIGKGCKKCKLGKNEKFVGKFLANNNFEFIWHHKVIINIQRLFVDFYIQSLGLMIEYNGLQHYQPVKFGSMTDQQAREAFIKQQKRDRSLRKYCKQNGINLLEIDGRIYHGQNLIKYLKSFDFQNIKKVA